MTTDVNIFECKKETTDTIVDFIAQYLEESHLNSQFIDESNAALLAEFVDTLYRDNLRMKDKIDSIITSLDKLSNSVLYYPPSDSSDD